MAMRQRELLLYIMDKRQISHSQKSGRQYFGSQPGESAEGVGNSPHSLRLIEKMLERHDLPRQKWVQRKDSHLKDSQSIQGKWLPSSA